MRTILRQPTCLRASVSSIGLMLVVGCSRGPSDGEGARASSRPTATAQSTGDALEGASSKPHVEVEQGPGETWREQTLEELCKDWKGAYYPPAGHVPSDTPGPEVVSPGIACGYRPVGWDGARRLIDDLSEEERDQHFEVFKRAIVLMGREEKTAREVVTILKQEHTFEHIGLGQLFGFDTIHFTLLGGAPVIVQPGRRQLDPPRRDRANDIKDKPLYAICLGDTEMNWPLAGSTPMDKPTAEFLALRFPCKLTPHEPELAELDPTLRRKQDAIKARAKTLLEEDGLTTVETVARLREEFDGFEYLFTDAARLSSINFKLRGGTTESIIPPR